MAALMQGEADGDLVYQVWADAESDPKVAELLRQNGREETRHGERVEQVKKFRLIEQKLTAEDEELTPTMKLKRKLVNEKYRDLIESMYVKEAA